MRIFCQLVHEQLQTRQAEEKAEQQKLLRRERSGKRRGSSPLDAAAPTAKFAAGATNADDALAGLAPVVTTQQMIISAPANVPTAAAVQTWLQQLGADDDDEAVAAYRAAKASGARICGTQASPSMLAPSGHVDSPFCRQPIPADLLQQLPADEGRFAAMVSNFHAGRGNVAHKVPTLAGAPLRLAAVFKEVLRRGGCYAVTQAKAWKDVVSTWTSIVLLCCSSYGVASACT